MMADPATWIAVTPVDLPLQSSTYLIYLLNQTGGVPGLKGAYKLSVRQTNR